MRCEVVCSQRLDEHRHITTSLLSRACDGDVQAAAELSPLLYDQLRAIARNLLRRERPDHTLQPTALVHEAYLQLVDESHLAGRDQEARARFLGYAANAMRQILIQHARGRAAAKRGGGKARVDIDDLAIALPLSDATLIDLDHALDKLAAINPTLAKLAELQLFAGLSVRELAPTMGLSLTTAKEHWALARAWLSRLLGTDGATSLSAAE
jgi:RNA polymerase sigma factor (TIGR02999 family)